METFTPLESPLDGLLIGLSAALLLLFTGRLAGISGIAGGLLARPPRTEVVWRMLFVAGLLAGGVVAVLITPERFAMTADRSLPALALAGLLVGFGTRLGGGCTSGHGVCGLGRLSARSLVATLTFMATGIATVFVVDHLLGGAS